MNPCAATIPSFWSAVLAVALLVLSSRAADTRTTLETIRFDGRMRSYRLHLPPTMASNAHVPLVIVLHGGGGNAWNAAEQTGFDAIADREGFIVAYPNGSGPAHPLLDAQGRGMYTWNAGSCCGYAARTGTDDVGFIHAMLDTIAHQYPIDRRRIYATGISNGGMMAYRLACQLSDVLAAIGVVAGTQMVECHPTAPVSVIHIHGTDDQYVPLAGGVGPKALDKTPKTPVEQTIAFWVKHNRCIPSPTVTTSDAVTTYTYTTADQHVAVVLMLIAHGGHAWPGGKRLSLLLDKPPTAIDASDVIWEFFASHAKQ